MIILTFVFAPLHLEITGYSLMLGVRDLHYNAQDLLIRYNFGYKPVLHLFFYLFFIPI